MQYERIMDAFVHSCAHNGHSNQPYLQTWWFPNVRPTQNSNGAWDPPLGWIRRGKKCRDERMSNVQAIQNSWCKNHRPLCKFLIVDIWMIEWYPARPKIKPLEPELRPSELIFPGSIADAFRVLGLLNLKPGQHNAFVGAYFSVLFRPYSRF